MSIKNMDDRRVKRTRQEIQLALLSLLEDKDLQSITVKDITNKAGINRATFYSHYDDKEAMIKQMAMELKGQLEDAIMIPDDENEENLEVIISQSFYHLFKHIEDNYFIYKMLLNRKSSNIITSRMTIVLKQSFEKRLSFLQQAEDKLLVPKDILLNYMACSTVGLISHWVANDLHYSAKFMTNQIMYLTTHGVLSSTGYAKEAN